MNRTTAAMSSLLRTSALARHEEHLSKFVNVDSHYIADDVNQSWRWSSGEEVLLDVLRVIARGHGRAHIDDLYKLDAENQAAVILALRIRLGLLDTGLEM